MCFDRLSDDEAIEATLPALLAAEWYCAVRNGALAGAMVVAVLLFEGTPAWLVVGSAAGAVALGTMLHQAVLLAGAGVLRARARWRDVRAGRRRNSTAVPTARRVATGTSDSVRHFCTNRCR